MRVNIVMYKQDDPAKCTAAKLVKFGLARMTQKTIPKTIVLNPFALEFLLSSDKRQANSLTAIDCSWNKADTTLSQKFIGYGRKLPPLLAGNPVNYAKQSKLTTVEAISAALYIMGYKTDSLKMLDKFKWGHTFHELNQNLLEDYHHAKDSNDIMAIAQDYRLCTEK